jgi:hypothetical protein
MQKSFIESEFQKISYNQPFFSSQSSFANTRNNKFIGGNNKFKNLLEVFEMEKKFR